MKFEPMTETELRREAEPMEETVGVEQWPCGFSRRSFHAWNREP